MLLAGRRCDPNLSLYGDDVTKCDLENTVRPLSVLGAGAYGIVLVVHLDADAMAMFPTPLQVPVCALKLVPVMHTASPEGRQSARREVFINEALRRAHIYDAGIVSLLYWTRWRPRDLASWMLHLPSGDERVVRMLRRLRDVDYYYALFMEANAGSKTLFSFTSSVAYIPAASLPPEPERRMFVACVLAHVVGQLACIRAVMPDFLHNDLHPDNVLLVAVGAASAVDSVLFDLPNGNALLVPFAATGYTIPRIMDFGFASGTYTDVNQTSHSFAETTLTLYTDVVTLADAMRATLLADGAAAYAPQPGSLSPTPEQRWYAGLDRITRMTRDDVRAPDAYHSLLMQSAVFAPLIVPALQRQQATVDAVFSAVTGGRQREPGASQMVSRVPALGTVAIEAITSERTKE